MPKQNVCGKSASRRCLKGVVSFLKAQIALLRGNVRSTETELAIRKLKECVKVLNDVKGTSSLADGGCACSGQRREGERDLVAPVRALKIGAYVKNFFAWLEASGVQLPASAMSSGLDLKWSVDTLGLWRPLFATAETLTTADRDGHRFWSKSFDFAGKTVFVNSQWYGDSRGVKQKRGFDRFAADLAEACGLTFAPYALPGMPVAESKSQSRDLVANNQGVGAHSGDGVTINITSMKRRAFSFKG